MGRLPNVSHYEVNEMGEGERSEFLEWYETQEPPFGNRRVVEQDCQDDVTVLRQACLVFQREFMHLRNLDVFLRSISIASACNKVLLTRFLQSDTIGLISIGGYTSNRNYSKKAMMWLRHIEETKGYTQCTVATVASTRYPNCPV